MTTRWIALIFGLLCGAPLLAASAATPATLPRVEVDELQVRGRTGTNDEVVRFAFDLTLHRAMEREELDEHLAEGQRRLMALGFFHAIDLQLLRGSKPGHVVILVVVTPEAQDYAGLNYIRTAYSKDNSNEYNFYEAFVGSRDLAGSGLRAELSVGRGTSDGQQNGQQYFDRSISDNNQAQLSLVDPDVGGTNVFAGLLAEFTQSRNSDTFAIKNPAQVSSESFATSQADVLAVVGHRFGLVNLSVGIDRGKLWEESDFPAELSHSPSWMTSESVLLTYSDKSFLSLVEAGSAFGVEMDRVISRPYSNPVFQVDLLHTFLFQEKHALTPEFMANASAIGGAAAGFYRTYMTSLTYQYVLRERLVLDCEYGENRSSGFTLSEHGDGIEHFERLGVAYASPSLIFDFSLIFGIAGDLGGLFQNPVIYQSHAKLAR